MAELSVQRPPGVAGVRRGVAAALLVVWALATGAEASGTPRLDASGTFPVPGGTAALIRAAGIPAAAEPQRALLVLIRSLYGPFAVRKGRVDAARLAASLSQTPVGTSGTGGPLEDRVPALLPARAWQQILAQEVPEERLATTILLDRAASFLYYGLFALDDETLDFFAARPALLASIRKRAPEAFAAYSDGIAVERGRVRVAGGREAERAWEAALGAAVTEPERFVTALLERGEGRLAQVFGSLGHLDAPHLAFALGPGARDLPALIDAAAAFNAPVQLPFASWSPVDVPLLLERIAVAADGSMAPPRGRAFWDAAFSRRAESALPSAEGQAVTAAWLVDRFAQMPLAQRRLSLDTLLFAQRIAARGKAVSESAWLAAAASFPALQTLFLTLEQLRAGDPADYAAASAAASSLAADAAATVSRRLALFQGSLALLARLVQVGTLATPKALILARQLFRLPPANRENFAGAVAEWLETSLTPELPAAQDADAEERLLRGLAGTAGAAQPTVIEWEGVAYAVDVARAERKRLETIREKQGGPRLDDALALHREVIEATDPAMPPGRVAEIAAKLHADATAAFSADDGPLFGFPVTSVQQRMIGAAKALQERPSTARSPRLHRRLADGVELVLAEVLASVVYALHADPDAPIVPGDGPDRRHDFGVGPTPGPGPWNFPDARSRVGFRGSLLVLERCLAGQALRPTMLGLPPRPPTLDAADVTAFAEAVIALNASRLTDESRDAIVAAIRRGRARVTEAAAEPGALGALLVARGVDGVRRRLALLAARTSPSQVFEYLSLAEVLALGDAEDASVPRELLDRWGPPLRLIDGSLGQRMPARLAWRESAPRPGSGLISAHVPDLQLRVAEWLADRRLPASLAPAILALAMWDLTMTVQVSGQDDWLPVVRAAHAVSFERLDDYSSALAAGGPLVRLRAAAKQE